MQVKCWPSMEYFGDNVREALERASRKRKAEETNLTQPRNSVTLKFNDKQLIFSVHAPNTESSIILPCPYACKEVYIKKKELLLHLQKVHKHRKTYVISLKYYCHHPKCSYNKMEKRKSFCMRMHLNEHYSKVHKNRTFLCDNCNSNFALLTDFNSHLKLCNAVFKKVPM